MIIDAKAYTGTCACGKEHSVTTRFMVIESGCMKDFDKYIKQYGIGGVGVAIYDENTYKATEGVHPWVAAEVILPAEGLHADEHGVELAKEKMPEKCDYLIAVGSGTVHDITRYISNEKGIPFVSCPCAASVDGFCSSVAAMTWKGFKKTFIATAPTIVVADLDIISKAPLRLTCSGFGDMIGKFIALTEWKIANALTGEYLCKMIYDMTKDATQAIIDSAEGIKKGELAAYEKLTYGLLMSGLAMQLLGNSRCASGAEHHISHFIEMRPAALSKGSEALHGEKVGVGTLMAFREYHRLCENPDVWTRDYERASDEYIKKIFGDVLSKSIISENKNDAAEGISAQLVKDHFEEIKEIVNELPTYEELLSKYELLGLKSSLEDIGVDASAYDLILECSPLIRNRLTLMRLRRAIV